jgi:cytochrome c
MNPARTLAVSVALVLFATTLAAQADGDPAKGRRVVCFGCHSATSDQSVLAPSLQGIVGRRAATRPGYAYSAAMKKAGEAGLVWTEENLARFMRSPRGEVPRTSMATAPITDDQKIADIIAYLKSDPKP